MKAYKNPTVLLVRHGKTALNEADPAKARIRSWLQIPLEEAGKAAVQETAENLAEGLVVQVISSDMIRAIDTAEIICDKLRKAGMTITNNPEKDLRDWNVGVLSGVSVIDAVTILNEYQNRVPNEPVVGGESFNEFANRFLLRFKAALDLAKKFSSAGVIMVLHARVIRLAMAYVLGGAKDILGKENPKEYLDLSSNSPLNVPDDPVEPAGVVALIFSGGKWKIEGRYDYSAEAKG